MSEKSHGYRLYWIVWAILLVLTLLMIVIGESHLAQIPKAAMLLLGSSVKASLIMFYFMHLRFEKAGLVFTVLVGLFVTGVLMFVLPAYDGVNIGQKVLFR